MSSQLAKLFSKPILIQASAYAGAGVATKAVGSIARYLDDRQAPAPVRAKTVKRESTLNGLAFGSLFAIQLLYSWASASPPAIKAISPKMASFLTKKTVEPLARLAMAVPAFAMAEFLSRAVAPRRVWENGRVIAVGDQANAESAGAKSLTLAPAPRLSTMDDRLFSRAAANAPAFTTVHFTPARAMAPQPRFTNAGGPFARFEG